MSLFRIEIERGRGMRGLVKMFDMYKSLLKFVNIETTCLFREINIRYNGLYNFLFVEYENKEMKFFVNFYYSSENFVNVENCFLVKL